MKTAFIHFWGDEDHNHRFHVMADDVDELKKGDPLEYGTDVLVTVDEVSVMEKSGGDIASRTWCFQELLKRLKQKGYSHITIAEPVEERFAWEKAATADVISQPWHFSDESEPIDEVIDEFDNYLIDQGF